MKVTLYHGSYIAVKSPMVSVGRRELDFGPGFMSRACVTKPNDGHSVYV